MLRLSVLLELYTFISLFTAMFLYNVISELNAQQITLVVFATGLLYLIYLVLFRKLPTLKTVILAVIAGLILTLISMLIVSGAPSGMQFHDKYGWPSQFYIVSKDTTASQEGVEILSLMSTPTFKAPNMFADLVLYTLISLLVIALIQSIKAKNKKEIVYLCFSLILSLGLLISIAGLNTYHNSFSEDNRTTTSLDNDIVNIQIPSVNSKSDGNIIVQKDMEAPVQIDVTIKSAVYEDGNLVLDIGFNGCGPFVFTLYLGEDRSSSTVPVIPASLIKTDDGSCDLWNSEKLKFSGTDILNALQLPSEASIILNFVGLGNDPIEVKLEDSVIGGLTKSITKSYLEKANLGIDLDGSSLPPHMLYYFPSETEDWKVVYTTEGSGEDQIFAAECYSVDNKGTVTKLGSYQAKTYNSYIVSDVDQLDEGTCKLKDLN